MKYAVIGSGGKQYRVAEGDIIEVDRLDSKEGEKVNFESVFLIVQDGQLEIGKPIVAGARVLGKIIENKKGEKIRVSKFKSKVRYRKTIGFRALLSKVQIEKIEKEGKKETKKTPKTTK